MGANDHHQFKTRHRSISAPPAGFSHTHKGREAENHYVKLSKLDWMMAQGPTSFKCL